MHVDNRKLAVSGLLMAFSVLLIILSGIIETNTLFLLALAAFCIGIMIREYGIGHGAAFLAGSLILGGLLAPQKLYCITYAMMGIYVVCVELLYVQLGKYRDRKKSRIFFIIGKFVIFNLMYLPALLFMPKLFFTGEIQQALLIAFIAGGQVALILYDKAYEYFLIHVWERMRNKLFKRR